MTPQPLDLKLTPEARDRFLDFLSGITEYPPTLCLMKGVRFEEPEDYWTYGAYAPQNIEGVTPMLKEHGHPLLYLVDGMVIAIPQPQFVSELVGKTLALGDGRLLVLSRD